MLKFKKMGRYSYRSNKLFRKKIVYAFYLVIVTLISLELILRIYYPFPTRVRGNRIEVATNIKYTLHNDFNKRLDSVIIHHRNSIGFRGPEPPAFPDSCLTIITVGGSTTECTFLSEGRTWPDRLGQKLKVIYPNCWINNAGLDGHSTFGHLNLVHYYFPTLPFKPKIILFLVGVNDIDRPDLDSYDSLLNNGIGFRIKKWLKRNSESVNLVYDIKNTFWPPAIFTDKQNWNFSSFGPIYLSERYKDSASKKQYDLLPAFKKRLYNIVQICRANNIQPVFMTQPLVFGDGSTVAGHIKIDYHPVHKTENGELFWRKLQLYNAATRSMASENKLLLIDLAGLIPKDTLYYYDMLHFTNEGAEKVAGIIARELEANRDRLLNK